MTIYILHGKINIHMKWKWIEAIKYEPHNLKFPIQIWLKLSVKWWRVFFGLNISNETKVIRMKNTNSNSNENVKTNRPTTTDRTKWSISNKLYVLLSSSLAWRVQWFSVPNAYLTINLNVRGFDFKTHFDKEWEAKTTLTKMRTTTTTTSREE